MERIFLTNIFRIGLGPMQHPILGVIGALSTGVNWLKHEGAHSPPSSVQVRMQTALLSSSLYTFQR